MQNTRKFTQEVKDEWVKALESGRYTQGFTNMKYKDRKNKTRHCCIGVLGEIYPELHNEDTSVERKECAYDFLDRNGIEFQDIWKVNDKIDTQPEDLDYSNVIETIKNLPVKE